MSTFDPDEIAKLGWRQGAFLGPLLGAEARKRAPCGIKVGESDWLIVTSHDCDIVNLSLEKEPVVELLRAPLADRKVPDKQQAWGRNPRTLQLEVKLEARVVVLCCRVRERWYLPRELLAKEAPASMLSDKTRRLLAEWLAKRYIRAAFPTRFDSRWRSKLKQWTELLEQHSRWVQGVYLRLKPLEELDSAQSYRCHLIVAVAAKMRKDPGWAARREALDREVSRFWNQFEPGIILDGVDVLRTDEVTLADIELYQRFDADWVSFADDSPSTPIAADMRL